MFERIKYPDGQIGAKMVKPEGSSPDHFIRERITNYEDLMYVRSIADTLDHNNIKGWKLFIPCLFGQRSDKRFTDSQSSDLKMIANVINECNFDEVHILDPHSDVTMYAINKSRKVSSLDYVEMSVADLISKGLDINNLLLISPDAGAYKKVFEYGEKLNLPVMAAVKHRDLDGKINLVFTGGVHERDCLIVDDLCDGGYTFELLGKALKDHGAKNVYLYVSHGIFSKGFSKLHETIDHIYCTNSIKDLPQWQQQDEQIFITNKDPRVDYVTQFKVI